MRAALLLAATIALAGCRGAEVSQADNEVLCNLKGQSFYVQRHVGDTSFVTRTPSADGLCAPLKPANHIPSQGT